MATGQELVGETPEHYYSTLYEADLPTIYF